MGIRPTPTDLPAGAITAARKKADAHEALRLCKAYANPLRHGMELSSTEQTAVSVAARILLSHKGSG